MGEKKYTNTAIRALMSKAVEKGPANTHPETILGFWFCCIIRFLKAARRAANCKSRLPVFLQTPVFGVQRSVGGDWMQTKALIKILTGRRRVITQTSQPEPLDSQQLSDSLIICQWPPVCPFSLTNQLKNHDLWKKYIINGKHYLTFKKNIILNC